MDLADLRVFVRVAELANFTRAAEELGQAKGRVSTAVAHLEATLGTRLLQRTTRSVRLTTDGEQLLERARHLLDEADHVQGLFRGAPLEIRGKLRVDLPIVIARDLVLPHLGDFMRQHPGLELALSTTDRRVDVIQEGFDCVLRIGGLGDADLVVRPLGLLHQRNAASPAYLARHGTPSTLAELVTHRLVHYSPTLAGNPPGWETFDGKTTHVQPMASVITVNGTDAYHGACLAGLGLIQAPFTGLQRPFQEGTLVEVLPAHRAAPMPVSLLYPHRRHLSQRVQVFMAWLADLVITHLADAPSEPPAPDPRQPPLHRTRLGRHPARS